jgi:Flp pilus assembly protein TadD
MNRNPDRIRLISLVLTTALASTALAGCAGHSGLRTQASASKALRPIDTAKTSKAVAAAERTVMVNPQNAAYRAALGTAYLNDGRFQSAATSFKDAVTLGDGSARTSLSLALAYIGSGDFQGAQTVLDDAREEITDGDLGLAYALAGQPERGIHILESTLRGGENTSKVRQNLAYSYALAGRWREARLMAMQDVPADQIDERIGEWAQTANPIAFQQRIAALLDVPAGRKDPGQPTALALGNTPTVEQLAAEAANSHRTAPVQTEASGELSPVAAAAPVPAPAPTIVAEPVTLARYDAPARGQPQNFEAELANSIPAGATPAKVIANSVKFVTSPAVQKLPERYGIKPQQKIVARPNPGVGTHLVQLGSFTSEDSARRAASTYGKRYSALTSHPMKITRAMVNGTNYWRVSAAGFGQDEAHNVCVRVKQRGDGCIPYRANAPLPGAIK